MRKMVKKILAIVGVFGFIYIGMHTNLIEDLFSCRAVDVGGGLIQYVLLGIIISLLIIKK